tara:strand:- start:1217 stop:1600 length:384 start_codon:yes stop_codon:yes gene_type:complete
MHRLVSHSCYFLLLCFSPHIYQLPIGDEDCDKEHYDAIPRPCFYRDEVDVAIDRFRVELALYNTLSTEELGTYFALGGVDPAERSMAPTMRPTEGPTQEPTVPTNAPTQPTEAPTKAPTTRRPTTGM